MEKYSNVDKMTYKIYKKRSMTGCTDTNCQYCLDHDKSYCISCKNPGEYPLFYQNTLDSSAKPQCLNQCPSNTFIYKSGCFNCHQNCKKCFGPVTNNCMECDTSSLYKYFDSG